MIYEEVGKVFFADSHIQYVSKNDKNQLRFLVTPVKIMIYAIYKIKLTRNLRILLNYHSISNL